MLILIDSQPLRIPTYEEVVLGLFDQDLFAKNYNLQLEKLISHLERIKKL